MSRIAYVSGAYVPHRQAAVHIEDRGYQFADGVYEVIAVRGGKLVDEEPHLRRLHRSLDELRIPAPIGDAALRNRSARGGAPQRLSRPGPCIFRSRAASRPASTPSRNRPDRFSS